MSKAQQMSKTEQRKIFARLRRHDADDISRLMAGATKDGTEWVFNAYWVVKRTEWAWAKLLPTGPGSYYIRSDGLVESGGPVPSIDRLFRPGWVDGEAKAVPLALDGVPLFSAAGRPLLRLGDKIIAVDLAKVADMFCVDELVYADIDGQVVYTGHKSTVRFTGVPEHPHQPLTVWRVPTGAPDGANPWRPIGIIMPCKAV